MQNLLLVDAPGGEAALLMSALRVDGFHVILAVSAVEARAVLASTPRTPVVLAIVDLMLRADGGTNGLELAREVTLAYPATRVLLTSAYHLSERQLERADCGVSGFIPKPYDIAEVVNFIRTKVAAPPSARRLWHSEEISRVVRSGAVDVEGKSLAPAASQRARR